MGTKVILLFGLATGCAERVPAAPTYDTDVRQLLLSNCVRCHEPSPVQTSIPNAASVPTNFRFDRLESTGCPVPADAGAEVPPCILGVTDMAERIVIRAGDEGTMPPAGPLSDAERELLKRWARAGSP